MAERPAHPGPRAAMRARLILEFDEASERQHIAETGWVSLDGQWVHLLSDEVGYWQTWPASAVVCIDWREFRVRPGVLAGTCGRLLVGQGTDQYDPLCVLPAGHTGACQSRELEGQARTDGGEIA